MSNMTATQHLEIIREKNRPTVNDYIPAIFNHFTELHGDRHYGDDAAILSGIATLNSTPVTVIAQVKGRNLEENKKSNFSMPHPEGYRKALRLAYQAEKFHRPVICFVDTPGAFCGVEAEKRGQGEAIAKNIAEFMTLKTPVISVVLGEGGSGGALALATANEVWMLENAMYSILSPEGFASILWKDSHRAKEAAACMKLTAEDLLGLGVIEKVFAEEEKLPEGLPKLTAELSKEIGFFLQKYEGINPEQVKEMRYERFRKIGNLQL